MFNNLTTEKIESHLRQLEQNTSSKAELKDKIGSLVKFSYWALGKGYLTQKQFNQMDSRLANYNFEASEIASPEASKPVISDLTREKALLQYLKLKKLPLRFYIATLVGIFLLVTLTLLSLPKKNIEPIFASNLKNNVLTFNGKITDKLGNPITDKTDVTFRIYTTPTSGTPIYTGNCTGMNAVTPDIKGTISVKIGKDCEMPSLASDLFANSQGLFLGISAGMDPEMQPRKQLANVNFSSNANNLQGLPVGYTPSSIPFINSDGDLLIEADDASITSVSKSSNFSLNSANILNIRSQNDLNIHTVSNGSIKFQTNTNDGDKDRLVITPQGNIGINGADPSLFTLQVSGDIGPNFSNLYSLGSFMNQWSTIYGNKIYQDGNEVCDTSNNCSSISQWSSLTAPTDSLALNMQGFTTKLTYGASTSTSNLFALTDTASNTGTGNLLDLSTAAGSNLNPLHINAAGNESLMVSRLGNVGIGIITPDAKLRVKETGSKNAVNYAGYFENASHNGNTDGINKYGLYITSTGSYTGWTGTATNNYGIYINTTAGADVNYDIYAASGAYLTTGGTWTNASSVDLKENFSPISQEEILSKINQLNLTTWNYKSENGSNRHLGPTAEDFYSIFNLGNSKGISTIDPAGVALAGIQALDRKINEAHLTSINDRGDISTAQSSHVYTYTGVVGNSTFTVPGYSTFINGRIVEGVKGFAEIIASTVKAGLVQTENLVVRNNALLRNVISDKITSPIVETETLVATREALLSTIRTNQIQALNDNVTVNLNASASSEASQEPRDPGDVAKFIINGLNNQAVTTIDAEGNIVTSGSITSETATISGSLSASSILAGELQTDSLNTNTATISGELVADTIRGRTIDEIRERINSNNGSLTSISSQVNEVQRLLAGIQNSPVTTPEELTGGSLANTEAGRLFGENTTVENISVNNQATLYKASISESLFIGSMVVKSESILSLNANLNISSLGSISFFENSVIIAKDGSITTTGQINALAGINTNKIRSLSNSDNISVVLGENIENDGSLQIQNAQEQTVASISKNGTGTFKELSLSKYLMSASSSAIIAASDNAVRNGQYAPAIETRSESAGMGAIPARSNEVIIYNDVVTESSLIYLTSTHPSQNANLVVLEKESCVNATQPCRSYFKVGIDEALSSTFTFNWLVIN